MSAEETDIKATRRLEDTATNRMDDVMSSFALNIGKLLVDDGNTNVLEIRQAVIDAINTSGYDQVINGMTNSGYQELINQSFELYSEISGDDSIRVEDETT